VLNFEKYLKLEPDVYHKKQIVQKMKNLQINTKDENLSIKLEKIISKLSENLKTN
jgi:hypothetical protein